MRTKRYIAWVVLLALTLSLLACKKDGGGKRDEGGKPSTSQNSDGKERSESKEGNGKEGNEGNEGNEGKKGKEDNDSKGGTYTVEVSASEGVTLWQMTVAYDEKADHVASLGGRKADGIRHSFVVKGNSRVGWLFSVGVSAVGVDDSSTMTVKVTKGGKVVLEGAAQGRILTVALEGGQLE